MLSNDQVARGQALLQRIRDGLTKVIFGQPDLVHLSILALASRGHLLLEGLPGLGKTELVKALAALTGLEFRRVQFTPDLLPQDITGGHILQEREGERRFEFHEGPIFANVVLADEINRASPKTQSALLEAMQEGRVTQLGESRDLPSPFFVLATQNPIELEGTYPLPEAQLDRFLFKVTVPRAGEDVLRRIVKERRRGTPPKLEAAVTREELDELFALVDDVFLPDAVASYISRLVTATHRDGGFAPELVRRYVRYGASPRAAIAIAESGRAAAILAGRANVDFDDVERVAAAAIGHRIVLDHAARLDDVTPHAVVRALLDGVPVNPKPIPEAIA